MRRLGLSILALSLAVSWAVLLASPSIAHGSCSHSIQPFYNPPVVSGGRVFSGVRVDCNGNQHDRYRVKFCTQLKVSGTWMDWDCDIRDSGVGWDKDSYDGFSVDGTLCTAGDKWRTRYYDADVFNNAGENVHPWGGTIYSSVVDVSQRAGC